MRTARVLAAVALAFILPLFLFLTLGMFVFIPFDEVVEGSKIHEKVIVGLLMVICVIFGGFLLRFLHSRKR